MWLRERVPSQKNPGPPGWGLGVGPITPPCKNVTITETRDILFKEYKRKIDKLRQEKLNLLKIVQQLADLGNPSVSFSGTVEDFYDTDNDITEDQGNNNNTCCEDNNNTVEEFLNYDVNDDVYEVEEEESFNEFQSVDANDEESSTSFEDLDVSLESTEDELM